MVEVVGLPDVDADECHELELRQPLPGGGGQGEEVAQHGHLRVDHVAAHLAGALGRLEAGLISSTAVGKRERENR